MGELTELEPGGNNPGGLRFWASVPDGLRPGSPLVVALHGCAQTAAGFDAGAGWSALGARHGFAVLLPEQQRANNANLCFNWFQREDVARGGGEVASIVAAVEAMAERHGLDPARVYVTGLSAGGAMTAALLATYPEAFAAGAIIAGLPFGCAYGMQQAFEAMNHCPVLSGRAWGDLVRAASPYRGPRPPVQVWHGGLDTVVRSGSSDELIKQWADVNGVLEPPSVERTADVVHRIWRASSGQEIVLEGYFLPHLGHGVPLHTGAVDMDASVGASGAHMLEAGIGSTAVIARSWGLLTQAPAARPARRAAEAPPHGIGDIIMDALRAAGLAS